MSYEGFRVGSLLNCDPPCSAYVQGQSEFHDGRLVSALARRDQGRLSRAFSMLFVRLKSCLVAEENPSSGVLHIDQFWFLRGLLSDPRGNVGLG